VLYCPGETTLRLLGADILSDETYSAVEQHVEGCSRCKAVLERFAQRHGDVVDPASPTLPRIDGFQILSEIDRGAMGVVYHAIETDLGRPVALKILSGGIRADASSDARRQWMREARAASKVRHPNLVPLYGCGEALGCFFLVLEYVPGGSLKNRLNGPVPDRVAAALLETIARAIGCIHGHGLFHLDLKPSNILLDGGTEGSWQGVTPRVSDFGLATMDGGADLSEQSLAFPRGTPSYMAPEQANADRSAIGAASDIYGLGAVLYELLTGRPPFQGTSMVETLDQVRALTPVAPRRLNPKIPRDLDTITLKCLEKPVSRRYSSADALADDLRRWLDGKPIKARPLSPVGNASRWCRRQPVVAGLAVSLSLTLVAGVVGLSALLLRSEMLRHRSESDYRVASRTLDELTNMIREDQAENANHPGYFADTQRWKTMERARDRQIELSKRAEHDIGNLRRLAIIDGHLVAFREINGKLEQALALEVEIIGCLEACLAHTPDDIEIREFLASAVTRLLWESAEGTNDNSYEHWNAKATANLRRLQGLPGAKFSQAMEVSRIHRVRADVLMARGQSDCARRELDDDLELMRSLSNATGGLTQFVVSEALTSAALAKPSFDLRLAGSTRRPWSAAEIEILEQGLGEFAARRLGWMRFLASSNGLIGQDAPMDAWADRVIDAVRSDATAFGLDHSHVPAICSGVRRWFPGLLSSLRRAKRFDQERVVVDHLLVLSKRLTQTFPDQATAYMLLHDGYVQRSKLAYHLDPESVLGWQQQALKAIAHAVSLDPDNDEARHMLRDRRDAVRNLIAP
jgi:serine/threonine protein kinase